MVESFSLPCPYRRAKDVPCVSHQIFTQASLSIATNDFSQMLNWLTVQSSQPIAQIPAA